MLTVTILFYLFVALAVIGALMTVTSRNPVRSVLSLIFTFVSTACVWLLLEVEFLALILIVVYVGAVMVLFMFVVMMLDVDRAELKSQLVKYWPISLVLGLLFLSLLGWCLTGGAFDLSHYPLPKPLPADYSSIQVLGTALFAHYLYAFEVAGVLLLAAMIAAITLTFRGRRPGVKGLTPQQQIKVDPSSRVHLVNLRSEKMQTEGEA